MKKQYLIYLLGLTAISIPMENSFLNVINSSSISITDVITRIELDE